MKNLINNSKKGILMVAMISTMLGFANETSSSNIHDNVEKTILDLNAVKKGDLIFIKNDTGAIVYKDSIQTNGIYQNDFDLATLPNGTYTYEVNKDVEISTTPFSVNSGKVTFNTLEEKTVFKPTTRIKDNLVFITHLQLDASPFKVEIYYINSGIAELLYSETIVNEKIIGRAYKLDSNEQENYKIVLKSNNKEYTKYINN